MICGKTQSAHPIAIECKDSNRVLQNKYLREFLKEEIRVQYFIMDNITALYLFLIAICFIVTFVVYRIRVKAGKNPWFWTVISFIITAIVLVIALLGLAYTEYTKDN